MEDIVRLGGDTDSAGALVGALSGAECGAKALPSEWLDGFCDWPRSKAWMRGLAESLGEMEKGKSPGPKAFFWPAILPRNLFFLVVVLGHGFRRMFPPYGN